MIKRVQLLVGALLVAATSGGWIHGISPPPPRYANWKQVAQDVPCDKVAKDGHDVKVIGPLIVDGKPHEQHVINDRELVEIVDDRCHFKHD